MKEWEPREKRTKIHRELPRVVLIGREAITATSNMGIPLKRHFSGYPKSKLLDIHWRSTGADYLMPRLKFNSNDLRTLSWSAAGRRQLNTLLNGKASQGRPSLLYKSRIFDPIEIDWHKFGGPPEVIYSTCGSASEFAFLHHFYRSLPKKVPILQHFVDVDFSDYDFLVDLYRELLPAIKTVWVNTKPTFYAVKHFSPVEPELVQALHLPLPKDFRMDHSELSRSFKTLLAGASHSRAALISMHQIWSNTQERIRNLPPISWVGHPPIAKKMKDPTVRLTGQTGQSAFQAHIRSADAGILPITSDTGSKDHSIHYNLASRISDYCAHGVPVIAFSFFNTATQQFVDEHEIGVVIDPTDRKLAVRKLAHFLQDKDWREECGRKARYLAEKDLDAEVYQTKLYSALAEISSDLFRPHFAKTSALSSIDARASKAYE